MDEHILAVEIGGELSCVGGAARLRYNYRETILADTLLCWLAAQRERFAMAERGESGDRFHCVIPWMMAVAEESRDGWREKRRRNPKRMGEMSQAAFLLKAQSLGFGLAVPWGDSEKCDFIVWAGRGGRLLRVQVKATGRLNGGGYDVQPVYSTRGEGKKAYTAEEIDVLAAHVVIERGGVERGAKDVWYLLPVEAIAGVKSLRFFPGLKGRDPKWEGYREAWEWLEGGG